MFALRIRKLSANAPRAVRAYAAKSKKQSRVAQQIVDDSTEFLFHRRPKDYISVWRVTDMLNRKTPPLPAIDYRTLSNNEWAQHQRANKLVDAMNRTEVLEDIFTEHLEYVPEFKNILSSSLKVNLVVSYTDPATGIGSVENYFDSALMGNYLEASRVSKPPVVTFPLDGQPADSYYTLVMLTPDYPFRLSPDGGSFIHWAVGNIPGNNVAEGETLAEYIPPLPTEYAGTFRYVFLLYRQTKKIDGLSLLREDQSEYTPHIDYAGVEALNKRRAIALDGFVEKYTDELDNSSLPVGVAFFRSDYDTSVSEYYANVLQTAEPVYTPPDVIYKQNVRDAKKREYGRFRNNWV